MYVIRFDRTRDPLVFKSLDLARAFQARLPFDTTILQLPDVDACYERYYAELAAGNQCFDVDSWKPYGADGTREDDVTWSASPLTFVEYVELATVYPIDHRGNVVEKRDWLESVVFAPDKESAIAHRQAAERAAEPPAVAE